jgi:hypothetical protein
MHARIVSANDISTDFGIQFGKGQFWRRVSFTAAEVPS